MSLRKETLIRNPRQPWAPWFEGAGIRLDEPTSGPMVEDAGLALQIAIEGQGIALARGLLVMRELEARRLVKLFDVVVADRYSYWFVWSKTSQKADAVKAVADWLLTEVAE